MGEIVAIENFIGKREISLEVKKVRTNPILDPHACPEELGHYRCRLHRPGREMIAYVSIDSEDGVLTPSDVLFMLAMDASGCMMLEGMGDFRNGLSEIIGGTDGNLEEIEEFWIEYQGRCRQAQEFRNFLGNSLFWELMQGLGLYS